MTLSLLLLVIWVAIVSASSVGWLGRYHNVAIAVVGFLYVIVVLLESFRLY